MATASTDGRKKVVITGGCGNLGSKLAQHLNDSWTVALLEHPNFFRKEVVPEGATITLCDLGDPERIGDWEAVFEDAEAVVHFSAVNPYPNASWSECAQSCDHIFNVFTVACAKGVNRVVFASSNHVMGGYKDMKPSLAAESLLPSLEPKVGTKVASVSASGDAIAYASAKLAGERLAASLAAQHAPKTTFVVLRVGWCQPGENLPTTLSAEGSPPEFLSELPVDGAPSLATSEADPLKENDEQWFKGMWLSNRDFLSYFTAALSVDIPVSWPEEETEYCAKYHRHRRKGFLIVNAMSSNTGAKWSLEETSSILGVFSKDDSFHSGAYHPQKSSNGH